MIGQTTDIKLIVNFYITELWARRWIALGIAWVVCVAGLLYVASLPDEYRSQTRIYVDTESLLNPLMQGLAVQQNPGRQLEFIRRTLLSRPNLEKLVSDTNLDLKIKTLDPEKFARQQEELITSVQRRIRVGLDGQNLFRIQYTSTTPEEARDVTEGMLKIFREQNVSDQRSDLVQSRRFIDNQIVEYENRLQEAERRVADFRAQNAEELRQTTGATQRVNSLESNLRSMEVQLQSAIWARDQLRVQLEGTPRYLTDKTGAPTGPLPAGLGQCGQMVENRRMLLTNLRPDHPTVRGLDRMIEAMGCNATPQGGDEEGLFALEDPLAEDPLQPELPVNPSYVELQNAIRNAELGIEALEYRMGIFRDQLDQAREDAENTPQVQLRLSQLNRDYQAIRNTYNTLIQRRESARLAQSLEDEATSIEIRVVEPPVLPLLPSGPDRLILSLGVLVVSLGAGVGVSFLLIQLNNSYRTIAELKNQFGLPVLGAVTKLNPGAAQRLLFEVPLMGAAVLGLLIMCGVFIYVYHIAMLRPDLGAIGNLVSGLF